ncbi:MmcQ/YjbR family DNA-binding protein [Salinibacterium sp.]|uniref:MmcQ/YjbR family DNA-binding protein n=1 Tax=Salinibacterium sp. TaxID=1915057 RepID=UPI00286A40E2|nr:MmcQ/YjbR family DNA-binding protein [Salinibacterium sp.]
MAQHYSASDAANSCAAFPAVELTYPFGPETQVYKVVGRIFAALNADGEHPRITLKTDPEDAKALVSEFVDITPGYHMNKKHWISVDLPTRNAPLDELIRASYELVIAGLPRAERPNP